LFRNFSPPFCEQSPFFGVFENIPNVAVKQFAECFKVLPRYRQTTTQFLDGGFTQFLIFAFGISQPPRSIKALCTNVGLDIGTIDYLLLHQANLFLNAKVAKKVGVPEEKCPHNIENYGNTSSGTIPLLMATTLRDEVANRPLKMIGCAFGVGLSWGSVLFETQQPLVSELVLVEDDYAAVYA
jgi:3-hydroxy-3-methylglutaryl CoA synthase